MKIQVDCKFPLPSEWQCSHVYDAFCMFKLENAVAGPDQLKAEPCFWRSLAACQVLLFGWSSPTSRSYNGSFGICQSGASVLSGRHSSTDRVEFTPLRNMTTESRCAKAVGVRASLSSYCCCNKLGEFYWLIRFVGCDMY